MEIKRELIEELAKLLDGDLVSAALMYWERNLGLGQPEEDEARAQTVRRVQEIGKKLLELLAPSEGPRHGVCDGYCPEGEHTHPW